MYLRTLTLAEQPIHLFDLGIVANERHQRRAILDSDLTDYFFEQNQISYIYHAAGKSAKLRLEPLLLQNSIELEPSQKHDYQLAISYALPLVAVSWSDKLIALDICQPSEFDDMKDSDIEKFYQLFLPHLLHKAPQKSELAKHWSMYEAKLKALGLPLQEYDSRLAQSFKTVANASQFFSYHNQSYWLTLAQPTQQVNIAPLTKIA